MKSIPACRPPSSSQVTPVLIFIGHKKTVNDFSAEGLMQTIGFIGVGNIGMAICKHLIDSGHKVLGYRRSSLAEFEKIGGIAAKSPADVGSQAEYRVLLFARRQRPRRSGDRTERSVEERP